MAIGGALHVQVIGDKKTRKMFKKLPLIMQKKIARKAVRRAAKGIQRNVANATPRDTGKLQAAISAAPIHSRSRNRKLIRMGFEMPTRATLGIAMYGRTKDGRLYRVGYYPTAIEYGYALTRNDKIIMLVPPQRYIRKTTDKLKPVYYRQMGRDIATITTEARRLGNRFKSK